MTNPAFRRALLALSHPLTVGAVLLLLVNDHLLRHWWPSWWTGKLGDAAWLVFAPLLLALLLAVIIPARLRRQETLVGALAFALTGTGFALAKTVPAVHTLAVGTLEALTGWGSALRMDPTDLLTLPALLAGWHIWQASTRQPSAHRARGWTVLALGALATLANSPAPSYGIDCLTPGDNGSLLAFSSNSWRGEVYTSQDGGLSWELVPPDQGLEPRDLAAPGVCPDRYAAFDLTDPSDPQTVYRLTPGSGVERSTDGGQTWTAEFILRGVEPRMIYYQANRVEATDAVSGPLHGLIDPASGNLVAAMGHEGVLVRTAGGEWQWVAVGGYFREEVGQLDRLLLILTGEIALAGNLILLGFGTLVLLALTRRWWAFVLAGLVWAAWIIAAVFGPAPNTSTYFAAPIWLTIAGAVLLTLALVVFGVARALRRGAARLFIPAAAVALISGLLFLLPYVLWVRGAIPHYTSAVVFALILAVVPLIGGGVAARGVARTLPALEPLAGKPEEADR